MNTIKLNKDISIKHPNTFYIRMAEVMGYEASDNTCSNAKEVYVSHECLQYIIEQSAMGLEKEIEEENSDESAFMKFRVHKAGGPVRFITKAYGSRLPNVDTSIVDPIDGFTVRYEDTAFYEDNE